MRFARVLLLCVGLAATTAAAQNSASIPTPPGNDTLVVKPRKPPPPPPPPPTGRCVPGTVCPTPPAPDSSPEPKPGQKPDPATGVPARRDPRPGSTRGATPEETTEETNEETLAPETPGVAPNVSTPAAARSPTAAPPVPASAPDRLPELLIASSSIAESDEQRVWLAQRGVRVARRRVLANLGWVLSVYQVAPGTDVTALLTEFASQWPDALPENNQRYLPLSAPGQGAARYGAALVGLPESGCHRSVSLAMLDGPVNLAVPGLAERVRVVDIADRSRDPDYAHATGIAVLWLGDGEAPGLLPRARLLAVNVFAGRSGDSHTSTEWILRGLDAVLAEKPRPAVVNLSFGGPQSAQLARAIQKVQRLMRVVAAAGNDGQRRPVYPAAFSGVVAVSAVDARRRIWPRANSGDFVSLAAPGVDVWTLDGAGRGYYASGTSFAAVFVSAALALGAPEQDALDAWLARHAEDLGHAGRDPVYGRGLLRAHGLCEPGKSAD